MRCDCIHEPCRHSAYCFHGAASTLLLTWLSQMVDFGRELMGWLILSAGVMTFLISLLIYNSK